MTTVPANPLLTDRGGASARIRVDNGSTDFFAGREFRTFRKFSGLAAGASIYFKVESPIDFEVLGLGIQVDDGWCSLEAFADGPGDPVVPAGAFNVPLPIFGANRMLSRPKDSLGNYYAPQIVINEGAPAVPGPAGTFTGGVLLDPLSARTSSSTAQASTQDAAVAGERGLPPGTVWLKITNIGSGTATGKMQARWADRPVLP